MSRFLYESKINVLDWPSYSPDLSIMEKFSSYLSKEIHGQGRLQNRRHLQSKFLVQRNPIALRGKFISIHNDKTVRSSRKAWTTLKILAENFYSQIKKSYGELCKSTNQKSLY